MNIDPDFWEVWERSVRDLTLSGKRIAKPVCIETLMLILVANGDNETEILPLENFEHLDVLRFEVDMLLGAFSWAVQVMQTWSEPEKRLLELIIYDDSALESTNERRCTQRRWEDDPSVWSICDSWQKWWEFITDALLNAFSPTFDNKGTGFHGNFVITFVSTESWTGSVTPTSHFCYAERLLDSYRARL